MRVSQMHAGKGWGYMDLPRIGEEVIVDFLEGDPDQPIITGRVYNADNMPPFALPAGKTRRGNTTKTHKGGGYNEMSMDDTQGAEQIRIHAQYNMDTVVENNQTLKVGVDRTGEIGNNDSLKVGVNQTKEVGNDESNKVGNNQTDNVGNDLKITAGNSITLECGASKIYMHKSGFVSISGTLLSVTFAVNMNFVAPVIEIGAGVALLEAAPSIFIAGGLTHVVGGKLCSVKGSKVDVIASGELLAQGNPIKLN
jgi:type VI secretion system secreted protein VgrG